MIPNIFVFVFLTDPTNTVSLQSKSVVSEYGPLKVCIPHDAGSRPVRDRQIVRFRTHRKVSTYWVRKWTKKKEFYDTSRKFGKSG